MLSKNKIKYLSSLSDKKDRMENKAFLVEGEKIVLELLTSYFKVKELYFTPKSASIIQSLNSTENIELTEISESEALRITTQKKPQGIFAEAVIPENFYNEDFSYSGNLVLALHDIQDPGNFGTIIRTADWFGIKQIICTRTTVDILNPKVLQSTMGAVFRVKVIYTDLKEAIANFKIKFPDYPVFAAVLEGQNIYQCSFKESGILMMGNESKGLSSDLIELATDKITIPRFGNTLESSESLNVSVATAIIVSELCRRMV